MQEDPTFDTLESLAWQRLSEAVTAASDPLHTMSVATLGLDGSPQCRTVVLRWAERSTARVGFHCDRRSPKFSELRQDPRATLLLYDAPGKLQLRLRVGVTLHTAESPASLWRLRWDSSSRSGKLCYATPLAPTTPIASPRELSPDELTEDETTGQPNFVAAECQLLSMEVLRLRFNGHIRARWRYHIEGSAVEHVGAEWLAP